MDTKVEVLPSKGYLTESGTADGSKEIEKQISDFLMKIGNCGKAVCHMGYWVCSHSNANFFGGLCKENGTNPINDNCTIYISRWAVGGL